MGKKSRRNKTGGGKAARPAASSPSAATSSSILDAIDMTACALCNVELDLSHWDGKQTKVIPCCGHLICHKCHLCTDKKKEDATKRLNNLALDAVTDSTNLHDQIPQMFEIITKDINAPCDICGMQLPKNEKEYHARLVRLAEAGHSHAQYCLGCNYKNGKSVRKNPTKAIGWYKKASEGGFIMSRATLGEMYQMGTDVARSYSEARYWFELAPNHAIALDRLGHLYRDGKGVSQNKGKAMELFPKSAEQGYPGGLSDFGTLLYEQGRIEEALVQFEKGAKLEQYLGRYRGYITYCQYSTAISLTKLHRKEMDGDDPAKDPFPLILFWARRALMNGDEGPLLKVIEPQAHSHCRHCGKPDPQMKCSGCRAASYCNKVRAAGRSWIRSRLSTHNKLILPFFSFSFLFMR